MPSKKIVIFLIFLAVILLTNIVSVSKTEAQSAGCGTSGTAIATGLVSTPTITGNLVTSSGACVVDPKAAFVPFKIPTYEDLKSLYYTQANTTGSIIKHNLLTGDKTEADLSLTGAGTTSHLYSIAGNLDIRNNISGNTTGVVFVDRDLTITPSGGRLTHGTADTGLVLVVKGKIYIDKTVTRVNAVLISEDTICTASEGSPPSCPSGFSDPATTSQLVINGSLIALNPEKPIKFRRILPDNSQPAEKINHQVKYLVILRDLISDTYQKWAEIP